MSTPNPRDTLRRETPPRQHRDPLLRPPNFPPPPPGRDHLSAAEREWEEALDELDKQLDYEDIHGPGTSQHEGARWRYKPTYAPNIDLVLPSRDNPEKRNELLDAREERVMEEVKRDLDFVGRAQKFIGSASESSTSKGEEEAAVDFSGSSVDITRRKDAKEHAKSAGESKDAGKDAKRFDFNTYTASELRRDANKKAKAKKREEGKENLLQEVVDEWSRRLYILDGEGKIENISTSENEGRGPLKDEIKTDSDLGKDEYEIGESSVEKIIQNNPSFAEHYARYKKNAKSLAQIRKESEKRDRKYDRPVLDKEQYERLKKEWTPEKFVALRKKREEFRERVAAHKLASELDEYTVKKRTEMRWRMDYDRAFYRNTAAMRKGLLGDRLKDEDESIGAGAGAAFPIRPYAGGRRRFFQNEPENPTKQPQTQSEDTKLLGENEDENEDESEGESEGEKIGESEDEGMGGGAGAAWNINPYAGGAQQFFHNETESPQSSTEELRQSTNPTKPKIHNPYGSDSSKDSTSIPEGAIRNYPLSFSSMIVNEPFAQNEDMVDWSWKRALVIIATGMLLGALGVWMKG